MRPTLLLLQARLDGDPMADHERRCFVRRTGLPEENVVVYDLCQGPPSLDHVRRHDALTVGGSGDYYVSKRDLPQHERYLDLLREVVERGHPVFASCFGYQSMVQALGGEIVYDPDNTEVGTYELTLTRAGRQDELFGTLPPSFMGQMGHKDRATRHPDGLPNLASSVRSPNQAFRVPGKPIWASQFHPELDRDTNLDRLRHYIDGYAPLMNERERTEAEQRFVDSPETSGLLPRFIELVFDGSTG